MSLHEPRCLVCGTPLSRGSSFSRDVRDSEVCSDKCYDIYMTDEDKESKVFSETDVLEMVDSCFHMYGSSYRVEAREAITKIMKKRIKNGH